MKNTFARISTAAAALVLLGLSSLPAQAQLVINDTLTGGHSLFNWVALNGACLTAGDNSLTPSDGTQYTPATASLTIPACRVGSTNLAYYSGKTLVGGTTGTLPDASGFGALRLTNGDTTTGTNGNQQTGAVVSNFTFPTNEGVQVTWTSVTYGGNAYKNGGGVLSGADGMTFYLTDGSQPATTAVGGSGGSLGYSCSNTNGTYDGALKGYLAVGMDEFGNFSNAGDNTSPGAGGAKPGAIAVRGAGHTSWAWLNANYPAYYPSGTSASTQQTAVQTTCKTGFLYNYSGSSVSVTVPPYYINSWSASYSYTTTTTTTTTGLKVSNLTSSPSNGKCDSDGIPDSSAGTGTCTYTNISHSGSGSSRRYSANYSYAVSTTTTTPGTVTGLGSSPSNGKCDSNGTPDNSGAGTCTYSNQTQLTSTSQSVASGSQIPANATSVTAQLDYNYPYLTGSSLPSGTTLFSQEALGTNSSGGSNAIRSNATPITYALKITSTGLLDFSYSVNGGATNTVLSGYNITGNNGPLPSLFRFGFSAGTGGGSNVHEITCFKAAPANTSNSSAGANVQQSAQVQAGTQVFLAYYHPVNWWGTLTANNLAYDATTDTLSASTLANWDASCVLTGGTCNSMSGAPTVTAQGPSARAVLSSSGYGAGLGVAFTAAGLSSAQLTALGDTTSSAPEVAYLRGDRTQEISNGGVYRTRTGVLGDIVDSSPTWVGYPTFSYTGPWADKLYGSATMPEGSSYASFKSTYATRQNVVYLGANDGMLHGFAAGSYAAPVGSAPPVYSSTGNNGAEVLAYVPAQVAATIHSPTASLDFSNPSYVHNFFVDATPGTGDLYYSGAWHTWVVGGLGAGGHVDGAVNDNTATITPTPVSSLFALDVTDPSQFREANAATLVVGDWSSSSITGCVNSPTTACGAYLGQTLGTPLIRRLHDGTWAVLFGNGTNSATAGSGLFIMHVASDGTTTFQYIAANTAAASGIAQIASADLDGDHVADFVYGGDLLGNLYRFDLTSSDPSKWSSMKLFQTASGQPITTAPTVSSVPGVGSGSAKLIIAFGTGQKLPQTVTNAEIYATGTQALYGIWDANMAAWNATATDTKYAALAQTNATTPITITTGTSGNLTAQTVTASTSITRTLSNNAICWAGSTACASGNTQMGWYFNLPSSTEQVIFNPSLANGNFFVNTTIPATSSALTCGTEPASGFTMGVSVANGGVGTVSAFVGGYSGYSLNGVGTGNVYSAGGGSFYGTNTNGTNGSPFQTQKLNPQPGVGSRLTWTKIR